MDIYQSITDTLVRQIEAGTTKWQMPWHSAVSVKMPRNLVSGRAYRGINVPVLWSTAIDKGYSSPFWLTYKQARERGGNVRKGEKGAMVVFWKAYQKTSMNSDGDEETSKHLAAKAYTVFHVSQCDGLEASVGPAPNPLSEGERVAHAEAFFNACGADVQRDSSRACYIPSADRIEMPAFGTFKTGAGYYATLGHEHVHWTGAKKRLDRDLSARFGDARYAGEELVAELGAAFLCGTLGISNEPRADHAQYLNHWLKVLKDDKRAIFTAASKAQAAVGYLEQFSQPKQENENASQ